MEVSYLFVVLVIMLAYTFDFTNGFHDAGNSIATIVATKVLTPTQAVLWAAFFNFIAFLFFKSVVATTIGIGLVDPDIISPKLVFSALVSGITWNMITWYFGLPSSSSHALIGGLAGAAIATGGLDSLVLSGFTKVIIAIVLSPLLGLIIGYSFTRIVGRLTRLNSEATNHRWFGRLQLISSALLSLSHGANDAQKIMGIIAITLYSNSMLGDHFYIPFWVMISCNLVMALGTLTGGWRIVETMGTKITHLNTLRGCCAETGAAMVIFAATRLGIPVSTTHIVTGAIAGTGGSPPKLGIHWSVMYKIFLTWILTIPMTALIAALIMCYFL